MRSHLSRRKAILKLPFNHLKIDTLQVLILGLVVGASAATAAYAISTSWTTSARIRVVTASLGVYQDSVLSSPVGNSNDWGVFHPGDQVSQSWWIRNEGGSALTLSWVSSLSGNSVTGYVSDTWSWNDGQNWRDLNGYSLAPGAVLATKYLVTISTLTSAATYSWSVTLNGA